MNSRIEKRTIKGLLALRKSNMLTVNSEYQRGAVWTAVQQKKLIDSVLRGYPLPVIYLHHKKRVIEDMVKDDLEIIDGQQRLNALELFKEGGINLFDPIIDDKIARFPKFVKDQPCPWAGLNFDSISADLKEQYLNTELSVAIVETDYDDEARDLFIRLQAGLPLNAQEKRDAWPGGFTEFVLKFGGKANNIKYPGHNFFKELLSKNRIDRGQVRVLCAQSAMLLFENAVEDNWMDIGTQPIDDYYYKQLSFDVQSSEANKYRAVVDKLYSLMGNRGLRKLKGHEAIHLILLANSLIGNCTPSWESKLINAFEDFRGKSALAKKEKFGRYWEQYVQWTMTSSDAKNSLLKRHNFFVEKMIEIMKPTIKDSVRAYGLLEREIIYYRDNKNCAICKSEIPWSEVEIHHVLEHHRGGETSLDNGVPVHSVCHPKGRAAEKFAEEYFANRI
ncbi:MAG: DUF262 domain-containing protein [Flavobacterium sp.]|nr:DUF262 domain-containing protein [Flavobacterium sp.]